MFVGDVESLADPARFLAGIDMIKRTGGARFQLRFSDDEKPVAWIAVGIWNATGQPRFEVAAGLDPLCAVMRLCEQVIDGGRCQHCSKPTAFEPVSIEDMPPLDRTLCWYQYDPELETYRRGCA
jgi:hypothetical protein